MKKILISFLLVMMGANMPGWAASSYNNYEDCEYFSAAFGLCSTHSHNIGAVDKDKSGVEQFPINPVNAEDIAYMNEIIGKKSTVIVQQLKQQYDYLNATLKRFKTQLEKAVYTSKIEVLTGQASGTSGSSSGGGTAQSGAVTNISGVQDCRRVGFEASFDCLTTNANLIMAVASSNAADARKQLRYDLSVADGFNLCGIDTDKIGNDKKCSVIAECAGEKFYDNAGNLLEVRDLRVNTQAIMNCAAAFVQKLGTAKYMLNRQNTARSK